MSENQKLSPYRWVILGVLWIAYLAVQLIRLNIGPIAPFLKDSLTLSNTQVDLLVTAAGITYIPALAISGWAADRFGIKRVLLFGTLFGGSLILIAYFFPTYQMIFILLTLSGAGFGCIFASAVKGIILWFPGNERATALGINQTAINISGITGAAIFPVIAGNINLGWQFCFLVSGIFILIIGTGVFFLYHDPPLQEQVQGVIISAKPTLSASIKLLKNRDIWLLALGALFMFSIEFSIVANLVLYLKEDLKFAVAAAAAILALTQVGGVINKPLSGLISDKWVRRRKPVYLVMCCMATVLCVLIAARIGQGSWLIYVLFILLGAVTNGAGGIYTAFVGELVPREFSGTIVGLATAIAVLGTLLGPPIFGLTVDMTGSYQIAWGIMAGFGLLAVILVASVKEKAIGSRV